MYLVDGEAIFLSLLPKDMQMPHVAMEKIYDDLPEAPFIRGQVIHLAGLPQSVDVIVQGDQGPDGILRGDVICSSFREFLSVLRAAFRDGSFQPADYYEEEQYFWDWDLSDEDIELIEEDKRSIDTEPEFKKRFGIGMREGPAHVDVALDGDGESVVVEGGVTYHHGPYDPARGLFEVAGPWSNWVQRRATEFLACGIQVTGPTTRQGLTGKDGGVYTAFQNDRMKMAISIWNWQGLCLTDLKSLPGVLPSRSDRYSMFFSSVEEVVEFVTPLFQDHFQYVPNPPPGGHRNDSIPAPKG